MRIFFKELFVDFEGVRTYYGRHIALEVEIPLNINYRPRPQDVLFYSLLNNSYCIGSNAYTYNLEDTVLSFLCVKRVASTKFLISMIKKFRVIGFSRSLRTFSIFNGMAREINDALIDNKVLDEDRHAIQNCYQLNSHVFNFVPTIHTVYSNSNFFRRRTTNDRYYFSSH